MKACRGEAVDRTPVWFMRQAGRYLPEYRDLRKKHSIHEICRSADLMVEATLQPIRRFEFDAAILFSDISILLEAMGVPMRLEEGKGPVFKKPLQSEADVRAFIAARPSVIPTEVEESLCHVGAAIRALTQKLPSHIPVIGFAGSPFTLAAYLIEGGYVRDFPATREFIYRHPAAFDELMEKMTDAVSRYVIFQLESGASAFQIFDTWAVALSPAQFKKFVLPCLIRLFHALRPPESRSPTPDPRSPAPGIYFAPSGSALLPLLHQTGADVLSVDWRVSLTEVRRAVSETGFLSSRRPSPYRPSVRAIQGNLDPAALFLPKDELIAAVKAVLKDNAGHPGHIFNLGHGVLPRTPLESVETVVKSVHSLSPEYFRRHK